MPRKLDLILKDCKKALLKLSDVLDQENNEYMRDSAIQRFEFCFELAWKTLKICLFEYYHRDCISPKQCFREAYSAGLIKYNNKWMEIADMRNQTAHVYNEKMAQKIYDKLPGALKLFEELIFNIEQKL